MAALKFKVNYLEAGKIRLIFQSKEKPHEPRRTSISQSA